MTTGTLTQLERYRSKHRIQPNTAFRITGKVLVCSVDSIRIHANRGNGAKWRHDEAEVNEAARRQRWIEENDL